MKTSNFFILTSFTFCLFLSTLSTNAQQVVVQNGVEYMTDKEEIEDENTLSLDLVSTVKKTENKTSLKKKAAQRNVSASDVEKMLSRGNSIRYRKKRNSEKCFEETVNECDKKE